ncbi:MAG TPA: radical SAM protein [Candidatus Mcinerneyibacteriales bacterium]|nr:radical SAM protein [Candidatus Mcinerneyibacteriales bacterium]HPE20842.1 radical SAM protein [Candidatus Mcinerneyibacteriales bacterium]
MKFVETSGVTPFTRALFQGEPYTVVNPYKGCQYGCSHCSAQIPTKTAYPGYRWGEIVEVREDILDSVEKNASRWAGKKIYLSSLGDPYQPAEKKYKITRGLLERLADIDCHVRLITHSDLVLRDLDVLKHMNNVHVGISLTTTNDFHVKLIEGKLPSSDERVETLYALGDSGITTFLNIDPFLPEITPLFRLIDLFNDDVSFFRIASPNWKANIVKKNLFELLKIYEPELFIRYQTIYLKNGKYYDEIRKKMNKNESSRSVEIDITI